jgi:hypothetical protein
MTRGIRREAAGWRRWSAAGVVGLAIVACGALPRAGAAQEPQPPQGPPPRQSPVTQEERARIGSAARLLIVTVQDTIVGRPHGWIADWLLLRDGRRVALEEVAAIDAVETRSAAYARRGAVAGLAAGGAASLLLRDGEADGNQQVGETMVNMAAGALAGAALGGLLGGRRELREPLYRAPEGVVLQAPLGLLEQRVGGGRGAVRTRLAVAPFVGVATFGTRTRRETVARTAYGLSSAQEGGVQALWALGPRSALRLGGAVGTASPRLGEGGAAQILDERVVLGRGEIGVELRTRADVGGYFIVAADGLYNPEGYIVNQDVDAGVVPRLGLGVGYDVFGAGDRRLRAEWIYRVGRYHHPEVRALGYTPTRIVRDRSFSVGVHLPLLRPAAR